MNKSILMFIVIGMAVGAAQAGVLTNGSFEVDAALVPNPGDKAQVPPTGWEYDRYYGYDVDPWLENISLLGDGSGGGVGVGFGTWNVEGAWAPVLSTYPAAAVEPGNYTFEITVISTGGAGGGWVDVQLGWFEDPADPWGTYAEYIREWIDVSAAFGDGNWGTVTRNFEVTAADEGVGKHWYLWLRGESYNDYVIVGGVKLGIPLAHDPADGSEDVCRDVVLSWEARDYVPATNGHRVYFSDTLAEVAGGLAAADRGLTNDPVYDTANLPFELDYRTKYYWRVDQYDPASGWETGDVWQFTTKSLLDPVENVTATADSNDTNKGPENTLDLEGDLHSADTSTMWLSVSGAGAPSIQFEFDGIYKLSEMWVWNYNGEGPLSWYGLKDVTIEHSTDGVEYTTLGTTHEFALAPGAADYAHNTTIDFGGALAKYVKITAVSNHSNDAFDQYGLSEVRFYHAAAKAKGAYWPLPEATGVALDTTLSWTPGAEAATHDVYLSTDEQAVTQGTATPDSVAGGEKCRANYGPLSLELDKTYYWKVNEVNMAEEPSTWEGDVQSFSTPEYIVVEDFESYNDTEGSEVFSTWVDGFNVQGNGSQMGHLQTPYLEGAIVNGGSWSAPLYYDNTGSSNSQATRTFDSPQNWTVGGIRTLTLFFYGQSDNTTPVAGEQMYVKLNGAKVAYDGDMADITQPGWHQWDIDLASFGTNLASVTTIAIGFDKGVNPASGVVYFDDLRLYSSRCVPSRRKPAGDLNSDCRFDHLDIEILTNNWLISTYQIDPQDPGTTDLIGYWPFDEGTGDLTWDVAPVGHLNDGILVDGPLWTTGPAGYGNAISFDGPKEDGFNDYVVCAERAGDSPGVYPPELMPAAFTVSCWLNLDNFSYFSSFVGNGADNGDNECGFFLYNTGWLGANGQDFGLAIRTETEMGYVETPNIYQTGTWYHLAASYDGANVRIYVDGVLAAGPQDVGGPMRWINVLDGNYPERFTIGVWLDAGYALWVDGTIDEVRYYSRALSDGQIGWLAGERDPYTQPLHLLLTPPEPAINAYDGDAMPIIDWKDFAVLAADTWLEQQLWP